jgi:hypothetical protein
MKNKSFSSIKKSSIYKKSTMLISRTWNLPKKIKSKLQFTFLTLKLKPLTKKK